jgi:hypothetical protein
MYTKRKGGSPRPCVAHVLGVFEFHGLCYLCVGAFWGGPKAVGEDFAYVGNVVPFGNV